MHFLTNKSALISADNALPGRQSVYLPSNRHIVTGNPLLPPFPDHLQQAQFGMGCFWGAERKFWQQAGVYTTVVGYAGGFTPNPNYDEVCSGLTGHNEVVRVIFDPNTIGYPDLLALFWESHNPTQGMRQGNDVGTQYRSSIDTFSASQLTAAMESLEHYQNQLRTAGIGAITSEIRCDPCFYYAEEYHQQYLAKNPQGYCGLGGLGVCFAKE